MAYTTIDDPSAHFQTTLYTGTSSSQSITNNGNSDLQPDLWWQINRDLGRGIYVADSSRGVTKYLTTFTTNADSTVSNYVTSFDSDGFSLGSGDTAVNNNAQRFVTWNWKANGGTTSSNTDGTITSTVQVNSDAGFSIVTYTGTGTAATVGHGLGVAPKFYVVKNRDATGTDWTCYHEGLTSNQYFLYLNSSAAQSNSVDFWNSTSPTSSVFSIKASSDNVNNSYDYVAYCFAEKQGFSKISKYTGNGNANGAFVYTGFKPAFVIIKKTSAENWHMFDNKRDSYNAMYKRLFPNLTNAENTAINPLIDFTSNGFKLRTSSTVINSSGTGYVYMAFAENPFVTSTGIPTTAR